MLSCYTGIHHNVVVTTCRILHTYRNIHSTCGKSVLLILNRTCAYGNVREDIIYILPVFWIKHLISSGESCLPDSSYMHFSDGVKALEHVWCLCRIRLMEHSFVTITSSSWLVSIYTWNDQYLILNFICNLCKTILIIANSILIICWTRSDDKYKSVIIAYENFSDLFISSGFDGFQLAWKRV